MLNWVNEKWKENNFHLEKFFQKNKQYKYTQGNEDFVEKVIDIIINKTSKEKYSKENIFTNFYENQQDDEIFIYQKKRASVFNLIFTYIESDSEYKSMLDDLYNSDWFSEEEKPNHETMIKYMSFAFYLVSNIKQIEK